MGYGEVGGDGSVQVTVHLKHGRPNEIDEGPPARVHAAADQGNQRSARARANAGPGSQGRAYRGQDGQGPAFGTDDPENVFTVAIHFTRQQDLDAARAELAKVTTLPAEVQFPLKVINRAGQVHVSWPDERSASNP